MNENGGRMSVVGSIISEIGAKIMRFQVLGHSGSVGKPEATHKWLSAIGTLSWYSDNMGSAHHRKKR